VPSCARYTGAAPKTPCWTLLFGAACTIPQLVLCLLTILQHAGEPSSASSTIISVTVAALAMSCLGIACSTMAAADEKGGRNASPEEGDTVAIMAISGAAEWEAGRESLVVLPQGNHSGVALPPLPPHTSK
jgi:hypothetical protein